MLTSSAVAAEARDIVVQGTGGPIAVKLFEGGHGSKRPAVIMLHGRRSVAEWPAPYTRYAEMVAAKDLDAYLVSYCDAADAVAMASADRATRVAYFNAHLASWADRVHDVVSYALAGGESSGKVGLLGFSLGGTIQEISEISTTVASAVEERGAATQAIARNAAGLGRHRHGNEEYRTGDAVSAARRRCR